MKKVLFTIAAAVMMLAATSCKKENVPENFNREPEAYEFLASVGGGMQQNAPRVNDGMGTLATFDPDSATWVMWQVGDRITVNGVEFTCTTNPGKGEGQVNRAYFENHDYEGIGFQAPEYHAFYSFSVTPSSEEGNYTEGTLKSIQIYDPQRQADNLPMYATSTDHWLNFNNICAAIKIYVPCEGAHSIVVSNTSAAMNGQFEMQNGVLVMQGSSSSNNKQITIKKQSIGASAYADFTICEPVYFALPAGSYENFCISFLDEEGTSLYTTGASKNALEVVANRIYNITSYGDYAPGNFSVSSTKKVQFTMGNLCYDVTAQKTYLAPNQIYYNTNVTGNERCYFSWNSNIAGATKLPYQTTTSGSIFASSMTLTDKPNETLTILSKNEWTYLLTRRTNSGKLYKLNVKVGDVYCLVIAPDGYDYTQNPLQEEYSMADVKSSGLVFLPYAGHISGSAPYAHTPRTDDSGFMGRYWTSTEYSDTEAYNLSLNSGGKGGTRQPNYNIHNVGKALGRSIRLVKVVPAQQE